MPLVTCILVNSEYSVHKRKKTAEGGVNVCDRSFWRFNRSFLPPLCFSVSSLSIFLAPYPRFKRASRAAGPSPWSSLPSGPPGCDLDARRSGLTLLLFCLEGFIDGPCLKASAPILVALRLYAVSTNRPWKIKVKHFPH